MDSRHRHSLPLKICRVNTRLRNYTRALVRHPCAVSISLCVLDNTPNSPPKWRGLYPKRVLKFMQKNLFVGRIFRWLNEEMQVGSDAILPMNAPLAHA